ncbi:MAG: pyridoxamine 5'-phosphate oxidase family protein [Pirellulaceae bacterium]|nr:pyridoxamine 5'-phosphate oxidase family protein [Pirellulaceae bacterium]
MTLGEYFEQANGFGVLATTDASGQVNQAIYVKPCFLDPDDDGTCCFIMTQRLSHDNVWRNPSASYLFIEDGGQFAGKRLSLRVIAEETKIEKIKEVRRRVDPPITEGESKYLVFFHVEGVRPLIGTE